MPTGVYGGTKTYWSEWGGGSRRAVLLHCSLAHSGVWAGVAEQLSDHLRLQAFDLPGHGQSGEWDKHQDIMDQTVLVGNDFINQEKIDLIGHSFGAAACLRMAVEHPGLIRTLVLFEPVFFAAAKVNGFDIEAPFAKFAKALEAGDKVTATRHFIAFWEDEGRWDTLPQPQRDALTSRIDLIAAGVPALHEDNAKLLAPGRFEGIAAPVLLAEGSTTPAIASAVNSALAERLPNVARRTIEGAGHMAPLTHPAQAVALIRDHLSL